MGRKKYCVIAAVIMCVVYGPARAAVSVSETSDFCTSLNHTLLCDFSNTSQDFVVGTVGQTVKEVTVTGAVGLSGSPPCHASLHIHSSIDVTLQAPATSIATNYISSTQPRTKYRSINSQISAQYKPIKFPSENIRSKQNGSVSSSTSVHTVMSSVSSTSVSSSVSHTSVPHSDGMVEGEEANCVANVSVVQSQVKWLRGHFNLMKLNLSKIDMVDGQFGTLDVSGRSEINNISSSAERVVIENSNINVLSRLEVKDDLKLQNVGIKNLISPGIILHNRTSQIVHGISRRPINPEVEGTRITVSNVSINFMESETLRLMSGEAVISNLRIAEALSSAITVQDGGTLVLRNVHIHSGPVTCLTLHGKATVVVDNFTLVNNTISHLEVSSKSSQTLPVHPLLTVLSATDETKAEDEWTGLSWYWIVIMAVVGIIAGIIVGSAMMWRRPRQPTVLTLSDLIGHGRATEENEEQTNDSPEHPPLMHQDSGLTSSSFASFTPCQELTRPFSVNLDNSDGPSINLSPSQMAYTRPFSVCLDQSSGSTRNLIAATSEPDICVHASPLASVHENAVFDET